MLLANDELFLDTITGHYFEKQKIESMLQHNGPLTYFDSIRHLILEAEYANENMERRNS
jgi:hypothetical protein